MMKKFLAGLVAAFFATAAYGQNAGTVTNHAFPIGKGPGIQGYTSLLCTSAQLAVGQAAADPICRTVSGDWTLSAGGVATLATVNGNVGTFGSATSCITTTQNAKGLTTAISAATCTPAIGSITGLGTGIATALGVNVGSAGAPVLFNGAGGTPTSLALANATGLPLTTGVTGVLPIANGGTGANISVSSGGMPYFNSATTMASSGALTLGEIMLGGGTSGPTTGTGCSIANSSVVCASATSFFPQFTLTNSTADVNASSFLWRKSRSGGNTLSSDFLADLEFYGFANAALNITGRIQYQQTAASSGSNIPGKMIFTTSNTAGQLNQTLTFDSASHVFNGQATAPTVTAGCNGAGVSVSGTDMAATITGQTAAATTCTLTFGTAYAAAPNCAITGLTSPLTGAITVAAGTIVTNFASTASYKWSYVCHGA